MKGDNIAGNGAENVRITPISTLGNGNTAFSASPKKEESSKETALRETEKTKGKAFYAQDRNNARRQKQNNRYGRQWQKKDKKRRQRMPPEKTKLT
ncbi:hypothetical protein IHE26_01625 [Plesiomonas shigelloides]|uniref:hypothetical protein n=1 Tax=Plesiomonas shigelloides TaxID=703 RepID=UPI001785BA7F|nr:hypothetical protein [Plesiomonas shigelloides]QOH80053.1 hypothetical protein IHE26_01625 [Plesiomonas shigelloides]